jgi:NAD(P)-dependent dehydrogenase (short-subunit alcohol dehydrogenase family)
MSKVWLVTGSASGLGRNIAEAVLASGDRLVATARDHVRLEGRRGLPFVVPGIKLSHACFS